MDGRWKANIIALGIIVLFLGVLAYYDNHVYSNINLGQEVILDDILPYANPTVDDLPPVTEDGSHLPDIPAIIL